MLYDALLERVTEAVGKCKVISLPCCIHLFGTYDFLAILPKKEALEVRFASTEKMNNKRVKQFVPLSAKSYKICICVTTKEDIDMELLSWLSMSYHLKDPK